VHIEKPHVVTDDQLTRLCAAQEAARKAGRGRIVSLGFNRPGSPFGTRMREQLWREDGELMQNWFIAGHEISPDHWYFREEEGGRVLGNLCHWTDLTYQMMPPERRFPIRIIPTRSAKSDCDIAVTYVFGDGSIAAITFSAKGHAFEGVKERYAAHRGNTLIAMDDFQRLVAHLTDHASAYGVDANRIAVFAESGATWAALPAVEDPSQSAIKAAVMYYGSANVDTFRSDLPLLWVRAGLDSPRTNADIARIAFLAIAQNAPVTLLNHPTGRHGFEGRDDNAVTRDVIEQTLAFIKRATSAHFQAAIRKVPADARK